MFLNFFPKKTLFEKRWFFICFVSVFRFVRDFKWKIQEFLRNWKTLVKKRSITLWFWNFQYFHPNLGFWKFLQKIWNFSQKRHHLSCDFEILEFWSNRHEIDLQRTVFFRSFENELFHIVMHQKLLSKDENSIWKGRNVWLWWFHSIIRRIFLFWKLYFCWDSNPCQRKRPRDFAQDILTRIGRTYSKWIWQFCHSKNRRDHGPLWSLVTLIIDSKRC